MMILGVKFYRQADVVDDDRSIVMLLLLVCSVSSLDANNN